MKLKNNRIKTNNKLIAVKNENYTALQNLGKFGQSFNDIITDLLKKYYLQYDSSHIVNIH
jgi:predicted CopG family antitoxin